jgi:AraC-like DNA-binding protein
MPECIARQSADGLEGSCAGETDWIRIGAGGRGLERLEAAFAGRGFEPHRHDTYALGLTVSGVQTFGYRGARARSLPGQAVLIHPDERHDGAAGAPGGFRYRILYLEPRLLAEASRRPAAPLPFVAEPVTGDPLIAAALHAALAELDAPLDELASDAILVALADRLAALSAGHRPPPGPIDRAAVTRARQCLDAGIDRPVGSQELERASGLSRFALARQFRRAFGTSPHRYLTLRRLDRSRALIAGGTSLAEAAAASGFADQSHMSRAFRQAYGVPPGRWRQLARRPAGNPQPSAAFAG